MKRQIQLVLLMLLFATQSFAQTNILEQMQVNKINVGNWIEKDNHYYFLSMQYGGPINNSLALEGRKATQYILNKYDKNTLQRLNWEVVAGDTLQNDTLLSTGFQMFLQKDTFYMLYSKIWNKGATNLESGYYIRKLDANFNIVLPEKRYDIVHKSWAGPLLGCVSPLPNGNVLIGQADDTMHFAEILILDHDGNIIQSQFPGISGTCGEGAPKLRSFIKLGSQNHVIAGEDLCGYSCSADITNFAFQVLDSNLQLLDTFYYKRGAVTSDTPMRFDETFLVNPTTISLPDGSLICSGGTSLALNPLSNAPNFPLITKHTRASRYGVDKYITFGPVNDADLAHGNLSTPFSTVYNAHDNNLYFADITHYGDYGVWGNSAKDISFIEIISLDTNLNLRWRKFIKLNGNYHILGINVVPDGRNGVIVGGYSNIGDTVDVNYDSRKMWVYYVDDNMPSADPALAISSITIHENGFTLYPNPAKDIVQITSEKSSLRSIVVYDISGRTLLTKSLNKQIETIDISAFGKGMYLLKCEDKDGKVFMDKVMKE